MSDNIRAERRQVLRLLAVAGATAGMAALSAPAAAVAKCEHDGTPLQFTPKTAPDPNPLENELTQYPKCPYCGVTRIDARAAWYVIGSDVLGPMGHELVPLRGEDEAKEFLRDHQGKRVARFDEVHQTLLEKIDQGKLE